MKLQGLIFDIDGTLVDSNDHHARCWIEAFDHFGKRFDYDVVRHQIGKGGDLLVPDLLNAREMRRFGEQVKKYRTDSYKRKYMREVKPFPGVRALFEQLRKRGIKLALASSSNPDEVEYYTQLLGVGDLLEATTSKHDDDILASHRCALPIIAVLSGGFERELLTKAEFVFENAREIADHYEDIDAYFSG